MNAKAIQAALLGCVLSISVSSAFACGESLFRVGKGVSFREYTAPLPGSILVVARTEAELALVERLAAAGHDIKVVSDASLIGDEVNGHHYDIVLAYFSERAEVESQIASTTTTYIPVAISGTAEESQVSRAYRRSLTNDASVKDFLKTIHRSLKDNA